MSSVFLTGGTGVVGRILVPLLVEAGHRVTVVGRTAPKRAWLESVGARAVALDLFDEEEARRALADAEADVLVNLATHIPTSVWSMLFRRSWRENDHIRREGSATLASAARVVGVARFVQESFAPVYEDGGEAWIDESWPVRPAPYSRTVLDAERSAGAFTDAGGTGVVLRFAGFYGPDATMRTMVGSVRRGWSPLPGRPGAYWSSISHADAAGAVAAMVATPEAPAGIYNVCDDEPLTRSDFGDTMAKALGVRSPRPMPGWLASLGGKTMELLSRSQRMSNRKLRNATGWAPRWPSVREGIRLALPPDGREHT